MPAAGLGTDLQQCRGLGVEDADVARRAIFHLKGGEAGAP
jgi:hypothetical protein